MGLLARSANAPVKPWPHVWPRLTDCLPDIVPAPKVLMIHVGIGCSNFYCQTNHIYSFLAY